MIKNYLKVAIRNIIKQKSYSFINIAGLSIGLTGVFLILLYVQYEFSYDKFHKNADNIYRVVMEKPGQVFNGKDWYNATPPLLANALKQDFPEVVKATRLEVVGGLISYKEKRFNERKFFFVDDDFFDIFTFPLIAGDPKKALNEPFSILITQETARKYFGTENPLGKTVQVDKTQDYKITGILMNAPANSHIKFDFLASFRTAAAIYGKEFLNNWRNMSFRTYIQIHDGVDPADLEKRLLQFQSKYQIDINKTKFHIQLLTGIHLYGNLNSELEANADIRYIYLISSIGFLIMLSACFNYMNLLTARSSLREKEIGMRKVIGANRFKLAMQFLGESVLFSFIALVLALFLVKLSLPTFSSLVDRNLQFDIFKNYRFLPGILGVTFLFGIISGSYPAFFLSALRPINILNRSLSISPKGSSILRGALVITQFVISTALIVCTIIINNQVNFIKDKPLGYGKQGVLTVYMRDKNLRKSYESFKDELRLNSKILDVTASYFLPPRIIPRGYASWEGQGPGEKLTIYRNMVDYNFINLYDIKLIKGRNFSKKFGSDIKNAYIINETAVKELGWSTSRDNQNSPIGEKFGFDGKREGIIIGVIKDFHFAPLHYKIEPLALNIEPDCFRYVSIKISPDDVPGTIRFIEKKFNNFAPGSEFEYSFLDERITRMYQSEQNLARSFIYLTIIAGLITCLGLFGLAAFTAERSVRAIGIRKVFGATISDILFLLSKKFAQWVITANIIAWPFVYYFMSKWLQDFAYRTGIGIGTFILSGLATMVIALLTVSFQAVKAAVSNPVDALRYE